MRKAPGRGRRAWSLSHVPWSLIDESVRIHRLLFGSDLLLSHEMVEPCLFSPAEPVDCYGFIMIFEFGNHIFSPAAFSTIHPPEGI